MSTSDKILNFIREEVGKKGYPPTVREIGDAVGLSSSSSTQGHLERLEKKGLIRRGNGPRKIELLEPPEKKIPVDEVKKAISEFWIKCQEHTENYQDAESLFEQKRDEGAAAAYEWAARRLEAVLA